MPKIPVLQTATASTKAIEVIAATVTVVAMAAAIGIGIENDVIGVGTEGLGDAKMLTEMK